MNTANHGATMSYNIQTCVDSKHGMIAAYQTTNKSVDRGQLHRVATGCKETLGIETELQIVADKGYDSPEDISKCLQAGIYPHVSMDGDFYEIYIEASDGQEASAPYENGRCNYLRHRNLVLCPMGKTLYPRCYHKKNRAGLYYNHRACRECTQKCTISKCKQQEVSMTEKHFSKAYNEDNLQVKRIRYFPNRSLQKQRKCLSEHPFGIVKRAMGFDHCLLTGMPQVHGEFALIFLAYNFKRAINILGVDKLLSALQA